MSTLRTANLEDTALGGIKVPAKYITQGSAKSWIYSIYSGGVPAPTATFNVSSITDKGTGDLQPNFINAMASTLFSVVVASQAGASWAHHSIAAVALATTSWRLNNYETSPALTDAANVHSPVFGTLA